jgi:hypothetical protein
MLNLYNEGFVRVIDDATLCDALIERGQISQLQVDEEKLAGQNAEFYRRLCAEGEA